jgi:hypothetical protein
MSPYSGSMQAVVERLATSLERVSILRGLISYRRALLQIGLVDGYQWLDGSFVEDVESARMRAPRDIDIVTFASSPADAADRMAWFEANKNLFDPRNTKKEFMCDAYFVDFRNSAKFLVDDTRYLFGLFSHQRETSLWKGMLKVPLLSDDVDAELLLSNIALGLEAKNAQKD